MSAFAGAQEGWIFREKTTDYIFSTKEISLNKNKLFVWVLAIKKDLGATDHPTAKYTISKESYVCGSDSVVLHSAIVSAKNGLVLSTFQNYQGVEQQLYPESAMERVLKAACSARSSRAYFSSIQQAISFSQVMFCFDEAGGQGYDTTEEGRRAYAECENRLNAQ
ncbi:hypothetical protein [Chitinibacter tainanensis]|uniref:hypothetical protein n=1 Tax=Chitinibacter tainanensis TaxID=230667 RepID=UPI0023523769|nr:hypothetical protein [Chitinibacter tainanensis]